MTTNAQVMGTTGVGTQPATQPKQAKSKGWKWRMLGWGLMLGLPILGAVIGSAVLPGPGTAGGAGIGALIAGKMGLMLGLSAGGVAGMMANMGCQRQANMEDAMYLKERMMPQLMQFQNLPYQTANNNYQQLQPIQGAGQQIAQYPQGQVPQYQQYPGQVVQPQGQVPQYQQPQGQYPPGQYSNQLLLPQNQMAQVLQQQANQISGNDPMMSMGPMGANSRMMTLWLMQQTRLHNARMALGIASQLAGGIMGGTMMEMGMYGVGRGLAYPMF